jgi:uncharacterized protein YidB (DUF937 family)
MGLMDVLKGMENGPHGAPGGSNGGGGGMSPMTMALLGLFAYKTVQHFTSHPVAQPIPPGGKNAVPPQRPAGGLSHVMTSGLGTLLAGGAAGSILSGGLNDLINQFKEKGQGEAAESWVGSGPNKSISADALAKVLSDDQVKTLTEHTGLSREQLLKGLSQLLPEAVNQMTPAGKSPTDKELQQLL